MPHIDPEDLALIALGQADNDPHLTQCAVCATELEELRSVVGVGRSSVSVQLESPPDTVWQRIENELGFVPRATDSTQISAEPSAEVSEEPSANLSPVSIEPTAEVSAEPSAKVSAKPSVNLSPDSAEPTAEVSAEHELVRPRPRRAKRARGRMAWALAAAIALVAVIGVTGWLVGTQQSAEQQIAVATLDAFPAHPDAVGSASVLETRDGSRILDVQLESSQPVDGYREVWLIDGNNSALISLGILQGDVGSFLIPEGVDLAAYDLVDVSVEPVDGDPQHSGDSIVRGPLQFE